MYVNIIIIDFEILVPSFDVLQGVNAIIPSFISVVQKLNPRMDLLLDQLLDQLQEQILVIRVVSMGLIIDAVKKVYK